LPESFRGGCSVGVVAGDELFRGALSNALTIPILNAPGKPFFLSSCSPRFLADRHDSPEQEIFDVGFKSCMKRSRS